MIQIGDSEWVHGICDSAQHLVELIRGRFHFQITGSEPIKNKGCEECSNSGEASRDHLGVNQVGNDLIMSASGAAYE